MTAILPITAISLREARYLLAPFLEPQEHIQEVVIVCPASIAYHVRRILQRTFSSVELANLPDVSLRPWQSHSEVASYTLKTAATVATDWVLIMDDKALAGLRESARSALLHPLNMTIPFGPFGDASLPTSPEPSLHRGSGEPAKYLRPPFVLQSSVAIALQDQISDTESWIDFGRRIAGLRMDGLGGLMVSADTQVPILPEERQATAVGIAAAKASLVINTSEQPLPAHIFPEKTEKYNAQASFLFFLPTRADLQRLLPLICKMQTRMDETHIRILVYHDIPERPGRHGWKSEILETYQCVVEYDILSGRVPLRFGVSGSRVLSGWLTRSRGPVHVLFTLHEIDPLVSFLMSKTTFQDATLVRIPRLDLVHTEWMSSLSLEEWQRKIC
jgi:hypothetical protein